MAVRTHEMAIVTVGERSAEIDLELVDLIEALWTLDIDTLFSCQGQIGPKVDPWTEPRGYILFPDVEDLRAFLVCFDDSTLSSRRFAQRHEWNAEARTRLPVGPPSWEIRGMVKPLDDDEVIEPGAPGFRFPGIVRFAQSDIPEMTKIVRKRASDEIRSGRSKSPSQCACYHA